MIPYEEMPEYREDLAKVEIDFPPLDAEQTARHAEFVEELVKYLLLEGEDVVAEDLTFLRSAQVAEQKYWIWELYDEVGERYYATASERPEGGRCIGYDSEEGLTPEQHLLAEYHACY